MAAAVCWLHGASGPLPSVPVLQSLFAPPLFLSPPRSGPLVPSVPSSRAVSLPRGPQTCQWYRDRVTGQFVSSAAPPGYGNHKFCLARTKDVRGGALEVWAGRLTGGDLVVVLFNRNAANMTHIAVQWADVGLDVSKRMKVRDLWGRQDLGVYAGSFTTRTPVELHGAVMLRMTAA